MDTAFGSQKLTIERTTAAQLRASDWLWRPWYAKLWWAAIPVWWAGMAAASMVEPLASFYDGAAAGFLNVLFFPMTALMVLGVGYVRHWLDRFVQPGAIKTGDFADLADDEEEYLRAFDEINATTDIHDPRSGGLYIGNPFSLQHPGRH